MKMKMNPYSIILTTFFLMIAGICVIPYLTVRLSPNRNSTVIRVTTHWQDATPLIMENRITSILEGALGRLKGIEKIESTSGYGISQIEIHIDRKINIEKFKLSLSSLLRFWHIKLPIESTFPQIDFVLEEENFIQMPLLTYALSGPYPPEDLIQKAQAIIHRHFSKMEGIENIEISKIKTKNHRFILNSHLLEKHEINFKDVFLQIQTYFEKQKIGIAKNDDVEHEIYIEPFQYDLELISVIPLLNKKGALIYLGNLGELTFETSTSDPEIKYNGKEQIELKFYGQKNTNHLQIADKIIEKFNTLKLQDEDLNFDLQQNESNRIKKEIKNIFLRILLSLSLIFVFLFGFYRDKNHLIIILIAISSNFLIACIFYYFLNIQIHVYSLAGIVISLCLTIDNVIFRLEDHKFAKQNSVFPVLITSTLTTLVGLIFVFLISKSTENWVDFCLIVSIHLLVSLIVSYYIIPSLCVYLRISNNLKSSIQFKRKFVLIFHYYKKILVFLYYYRKFGFFIVFLIFGLPIFLLPSKIDNSLIPDFIKPFSKVYNQTSSSIFPNEFKSFFLELTGGLWYIFYREQLKNSFEQTKDNHQKTQVLIRFSMPQGTYPDLMKEIVENFESQLNNPNYEIANYKTHMLNGAESLIEINFLDNHKTLSPLLLKKSLEKKAQQFGSADLYIQGVGNGFKNAINLLEFNSTIGISGYNYNQLEQIAVRITDSIKSHPRVHTIYVSPHAYVAQNTHLQNSIKLNNELSISQVYNFNEILEKQELFQSQRISLKMDQENVLSISSPKLKYTLWELLEIPFQNTYNKMGHFFTLEKTALNDNIKRLNQEYILFINYKFLGSSQGNFSFLENTVEQIKHWLPSGFGILKKPETINTKENHQLIAKFVLLIIICIYFLCSILFESFKKAFYVILMIPFSFIGVFSVLILLKLELSKGTLPSIIVLCGLVTNAALFVLHDFRNTRSTNESSFYRFSKAIHRKIFPVFITTLSAILSFLPFLGWSEEKSFWYILTASSLGGLLFSFIGILIFLPLLLIQPSDILKRKENNA